MNSNLLPKQGEVYYYPHFFTDNETTVFFSRLQTEIEWKQEPIKIFGREIMQPRLTAWYGDKKYSYSGIDLTPLPWTDVLLLIKERIEEISQVQFNSVLLNYYRNNQDSMGWHRDNEKELGKNPVIGSVSFGATRRFCLRHHLEKELKTTVNIEDGGYLLMKGETQHYWHHSVPKESREIGPRINLTFRYIQS